MMCALIEDLLPPSYFSSTLLGIQTDQRVLRQLIVQYLPALDRLLQEHDIGESKDIPLQEGGYREVLKHLFKSFHLLSPELSLITLHWFLTSFASVVDIRLLLRIWDLLFHQGSLVLFQITLGMLKIKVNSLTSFPLHGDADRICDCRRVFRLRRRNSYRRRTRRPFSTPCRTCRASSGTEPSCWEKRCGWRGRCRRRRWRPSGTSTWLTSSTSRRSSTTATTSSSTLI